LRIERLRNEFDLEVKWIAFPLHIDTPDEGVTLEQLFPGGMYNFKEAGMRQESFARDEGLDWSAGKGMSYNSTRAQVLGKWAESVGRGDAFHEAAFRTTFVDRLNIAEIFVLKSMAKAAGLDPDKVEEALEDKVYTDAVNSDWEYCRKSGISAVPTFSIEGRSISGAHPYETLRELVRGTGPQKIGGLNII